MSERQIGPSVRWIVFWGGPAAIVAVLMCNYEFLVRAVGEKTAPFLGLGIAGVVSIISLLLYDRIPTRLLIRIGIIGWILTLLLGYWYLQYGPSPF